MGVRYYYYGNYVIYYNNNNNKSESRCGCSSLIFVTAVIRNFSIFRFIQFFNFNFSSYIPRERNPRFLYNERRNFGKARECDFRNGRFRYFIFQCTAIS